MATRTFQNADMKKKVITNERMQDHAAITLVMMPDGAICLQPAGWPHGKMSDLFNTLIMLEPREVLALARFLSAEIISDRLLDVRQRLDKSPATRELLNDIARIRRQAARDAERPEPTPAQRAAYLQDLKDWIDEQLDQQVAEQDDLEEDFINLATRK